MTVLAYAEVQAAASRIEFQACEQGQQASPPGPWR